MKVTVESPEPRHQKISIKDVPFNTPFVFSSSADIDDPDVFHDRECICIKVGTNENYNCVALSKNYVCTVVESDLYYFFPAEFVEARVWNVPMQKIS